MLEPRGATEHREQPLPLHSRRNRLARSPDRQHAITAGRVVDAIGKVSSQIIVTDWLARGESAVAEHQERFPALHTLDLTRQRLEEGGRPNDRVVEPRRGEGVLNGELGMLEGENGLLHAKRR